MKKEIVHKCELCRRKVADKNNSHIVPSFIIFRNASSDGSGKRNHELVYSIGKNVQAYTGNEVPLEEFHQAIEYQKELVKRSIEESGLSKEIKEQKKRNIDASYSVIEEYLKNYYFKRIQ